MDDETIIAELGGAFYCQICGKRHRNIHGKAVQRCVAKAKRGRFLEVGTIIPDVPSFIENFREVQSRLERYRFTVKFEASPAEWLTDPRIEERYARWYTETRRKRDELQEQIHAIKNKFFRVHPAAEVTETRRYCDYDNVHAITIRTPENPDGEEFQAKTLLSYVFKPRFVEKTYTDAYDRFHAFNYEVYDVSKDLRYAIVQTRYWCGRSRCYERRIKYWLVSRDKVVCQVPPQFRKKIAQAIAWAKKRGYKVD